LGRGPRIMALAGKLDCRSMTSERELPTGSLEAF